MIKPNQDIRDEIKKSPVFTYTVAEEMGYSDNYFLTVLRHKLSEDKKKDIRAALKRAIKKNAELQKAAEV